MGPDREVTVRVYESKLKEVQTSAQVDEELRCQLGVDVQVEGEAEEWEITLSQEDGTIVKKERARGKVLWDIDAELWWPVGEGPPTQYTVNVDLLDKVCQFDHVRRAKLTTERHCGRHSNPEDRVQTS